MLKLLLSHVSPCLCVACGPGRGGGALSQESVQQLCPGTVPSFDLSPSYVPNDMIRVMVPVKWEDEQVTTDRYVFSTEED